MEYRFGRCSLRSEERALRCNGAIVPLPPKAVDALAVLAARPGEVVSKETLMDEVWGSACVEESNLTQSVYRLRRVFAEHDPAVRIETIPRRGYRLVVDCSPGDAAVFRAARFYRAIAAAVVLACIVAGSALFVRRPAAVTVPPSYATGYYYWSTARSSSDVRKSILYFNRAIEEQPNSALGYAGLAYAQLSLAMRDANTTQIIADARAGIAAAKRAINIDPTSAEGHAAYGQGEAVFGDPAIAQRELRRAVDLDPNSVEARTWYGELLMGDGRMDEASAQFRAAQAQNSTWTEAGDYLALLFYLRRDYTQALAYADQSLAQEPRDTMAPFVRALANAQVHRRNLAERALEPFARVTNIGASLKFKALLSLLYAQDGNARLAAAELSSTRRAVEKIGIVDNPSTIISIAATLAVQHQTDSAFAWLARIDPPSRKLFAGDARLDPLRADRRFGRWLTRS